jgi:hypothetical protein
MAISVTGIGTNNVFTGTTITLTGVTVPSGSLIVAHVVESQTGNVGSCADSVNTPYTEVTSVLINNSSSNGVLTSWYFANCGALSSQTITYTKGNSNKAATIAALYATGIATSSPLDSAATATAYGNSAAPTVTSGTPGTAGDLFIGVLGLVVFKTITQDSNWSTSFTAANTMQGGYRINAGTGTLSYAPTFSGSSSWAEMVFAFKANGGTNYNQTVSVSCTSTSLFGKAMSLTRSISCVSTSSFLKSAAKTLSISCTSTTQAVKKTANKLISVSCTSTTLFAKSVLKAIAITCTSTTAAISAIKVKLVSVAVSCVSATFGAKTVGKYVSVACVSTSTFAKSVARVLSIACVSTTSFIKSAARTVTVSCTSTTSIAKVYSALRTITVACVSTTSFGAKSIAKHVTVACVSTTAFIKGVSRNISVACTTATLVLHSTFTIYYRTVTAACTSTTSVAKGAGKVVVVSCVSTVSTFVKAVLIPIVRIFTGLTAAMGVAVLTSLQGKSKLTDNDGSADVEIG